ncbi:MAG: protein-disulfide reductase DsbD family protein [Candidatus Sumerlaeia bacterium]|nr:protein-disulfide reductase DsbD family protein [Candidatus Sumerlaeia bacterium]
MATVLCLVLLRATSAQETTVLWEFSLEPAVARAGEMVSVRISAIPQGNWYFYAHTNASGGPTPLRVRLDLPPGLSAAGALEAPAPKRKFDSGFQIEVDYYADPVVFQQRVQVGSDVAAGPLHIQGSVRYQSCNDTACLPPRETPFDLTLTIEAGPARLPSSPPPSAPSMPSTVSTSPTVAVAASRTIENAIQSGLFAFLLLALLQGFLALATPCVYPMIPITVSFFLKQGEREARRPILLATVYALTIVVTFTSVGLLLAAIYGPAGTSRLGASPVANLILAAFFVAFALSLFGLFEIQVPASVQSYLSAKGRGGGYTGTIFMGAAFTLASLACTAPFIGALLGLAAGGQWFWPAVGMLAFSVAFALPFFVLALFPQWLARMPKSGTWLNAVKVVMGFLVLAVAVKFISNADAVWQWGLLTREAVLAAWTAMALFAAVYLLGAIRLPHDSPVEHLGVGRMLLAMAFAALALYLAAGLFGGRIAGTLDAFLPAADTAVSPTISAGTPALPWIENYSDALARAKAENKPVFVDFTGITCTNCKWMERNIFVHPEVHRRLNAFVLARLWTDTGPDWEANQKMQVERFGTAALPFYAILSPDDRELARSAGLTRDPAKFSAFLDAGLKRHAERP